MKLSTPEQVNAVIKHEKATAKLRGMDEAERWLAENDPKRVDEVVQEKTRRALDLDQPEESVDAMDFAQAIRDILGNERGGWSTRKKNPIERLTAAQIGSIDKIIK